MIFAIWAIERKIRGRSLFLPCALGVLLILLIGLSRVYLGVHFPTDIVGGYIAGIIWLVFTVPVIYWQARMQLPSTPTGKCPRRLFVSLRVTTFIYEVSKAQQYQSSAFIKNVMVL
uniref:Phosphatase PAP2 family protein n=1 Tax=Paenibacillus polymyxa TaxID=1406 RepID=A0AAE9PQ18_PAEPO